jgi:hypothetical protein
VPLGRVRELRFAKRMPKVWSDRLLESHSLAVLAAFAVALVAFPGAHLTKRTQPAIAPPAPILAPVSSKGPESRLTGASVPADASAPAESRASEPAPKSTTPVSRPERVPADSRAFDGCLETYPESACRRAFDSAIERHARTNAPAGDVAISHASLTPLAFDHDPRWVRRLEALAEDGIAFKRVRTGPAHEWIFGITRDGVLGFSFEERRGD